MDSQHAARAHAASLELAVWREACRHLELEESLARIEPALAAALPLQAIAVRRFDRARNRLDTVAVVGDALTPPLAAGNDLTPTELADVLALFREPSFRLARRAPESAVGARLVPATEHADVLLAALSDEEGPLALVLLFARERFERRHAAEVACLVEPFGVALANDRRVHELARLREAAEAENRALLSRLGRSALVEHVVGERAGLRPVMERVAQVSGTDVPVLLLGETGSGKEVIARAIHDRSPRRAGPMVRVNSGALPPERVDSELFGHERGSFTGAVATRKGWFERADGGTLLLDEVGELPMAAQVRLLRVLQEGTLERVGGSKTLHVDVRIVAATHRDLHQMVERGSFREDLWYRISVFPLRLPPLRERPEDIPALAAHFAAKAAVRLGGQPLVPTPEDIAQLLAYPWPGNVRELSAVIERAAILGHARKLEVAAALGAGARVPATPRPSEPAPAPVAPATTTTTPASDTLDDAITAHIERVLVRTRGRIEGPKGAAAILGVNPHTLRARMRKLELDWSRFRAR
jgi:transcriptional regulator with GAF, ATPase, and Fis domain